MLRFLLGFFIIAVVFSGCQRTVDSTVGPSICPQDFEVVSPLKASVSSIDFTAISTPTVKFEATLSGRDYRWTLQIKGKKSKATKTFTGNSAVVNESWYGESDSSVFFQQEECDVLLTVNCIDVASSTTVAITQISDFSNLGYINKEGFWGSWVNAGVTYKEDTISLSGNVKQSPQGGSFYSMKASATPKLNWTFGGLGCYRNIPNVGINKYKYIEEIGNLSTDPNEIYLNFYANCGGNNNSQIQVFIGEQNEDAKAITKKPYYINAIDFSGWKLISINLGKDFHIDKPGKIKSVEIQLGAYPKESDNAEMNLDFMIFTKGKPFSK